MLVKLGKQGKKVVKKLITPVEKHYVGYTRRIERVKTTEKICAMTFDDGPMDLPASPDGFGGRAMTDVLLDTLQKFGAKGTFDVIGDTGQNYPDQAGKLGSAAWGGIQYDHYPDFGKDSHGGAEHCDRLITRMLAEGHQITNHGFRHILFGRKNFVYGRRATLGSLEAVLEDLQRLDDLMKIRYGYNVTMGRPAHYVDRIGDGFTSYDAYERMGYQYLAASFDGAGWLPSTLPDEQAALEAEVRAMVEPMRQALAQDENVFCGQIIFQKDGCNMAKRTPIAYALEQQLQLLAEYGYRVVTVAELMEASPFRDLGRDDPLFPKMQALAETAAVAFTDNNLRLEDNMRWGELAMLLCPKAEALARREAIIRRRGKAHAYAGAMDWCREAGLIPQNARPEGAVTSLPEGQFAPVADFTRRSVYEAYRV